MFCRRVNQDIIWELNELSSIAVLIYHTQQSKTTWWIFIELFFLLNPQANRSEYNWAKKNRKQSQVKTHQHSQIQIVILLLRGQHHQIYQGISAQSLQKIIAILICLLRNHSLDGPTSKIIQYWGHLLALSEIPCGCNWTFVKGNDTEQLIWGVFSYIQEYIQIERPQAEGGDIIVNIVYLSRQVENWRGKNIKKWH